MAKNRKSDATGLEEVDLGMYTAVCSAANSLSQLYSEAVHQQRLFFHAGELYAMEKLYSWMLRQQEDGVRVMPVDILSYLQNEFDYGTGEPQSSLPLHHQQHSQNFMQLTNSEIPLCCNAFGPATTGQGLRSVNSDQTKNSVFSNALSSPVHWSLQNYHLSQGGRSNENGNQTSNPNPSSYADTSMDMHADCPSHDSP